MLPAPGQTSLRWMQELVTCGLPPSMDPPPLSQTTQLMKVGTESLAQGGEYTPAAAFPVIVQFRRVGEADVQYTPAPEFPVIVQLVSVGEAIPQQSTPSPLPVIVQLVSVGELSWQPTPAPPPVSVNPSRREFAVSPSLKVTR